MTSHPEDKVEDVNLSLLVHHLHHRLDADQSTSTTDTGTERSKDKTTNSVVATLINAFIAFRVKESVKLVYQKKKCKRLDERRRTFNGDRLRGQKLEKLRGEGHGGGGLDGIIDSLVLIFLNFLLKYVA